MKPQTDDKLGPWLALFCVPNLSLKLAHQLLIQFGEASRVLKADEAELRRFKIKSRAIQAILDFQKDTQQSVIAKAVEMTLNWLAEAPDHHIIHWAHSAYPHRLKEIATPPLILFVVGDASLLNKPQIAFVGSRNPSINGQQLAQDFACRLSKMGVVITSGLALGIDGASHTGAVLNQAPTIAVMATGIDKVYPRRHQDLAQKIREIGALVSEFPLGHQPTPQSFPQRNRIISGLSLGVLVVEAAIKSGSLITARYALEQNREVFAIPGSIHNPVARGCHRLIRQGAKLVECVEDILEEIDCLIVPTEDKSKDMMLDTKDLTVKQVLVLEHLGFDAVDIDSLVDGTGIMVIELSSILAQLCLLGLVKQTGQGFVRVFQS